MIDTTLVTPFHMLNIIIFHGLCYLQSREVFTSMKYFEIICFINYVGETYKDPLIEPKHVLT